MPYTGDNSEKEFTAHNGDRPQNYGATGGDNDTDQLSQIMHELQRIIRHIEIANKTFSPKEESFLNSELSNLLLLGCINLSDENPNVFHQSRVPKKNGK